MDFEWDAKRHRRIWKSTGSDLKLRQRFLSTRTLAFFKGNDPKGYTDRMAAVLKAYVQAHQPK